MTKICRGCGVTLQSENPEAPGYIPLAGLTRENPICQRCYRLIHYGDLTPVSVKESEEREAIRRAVLSADALIYIVDVTDIEAGWDADLLTLGRPVYLVMNKFDLLPKEKSLNEARQWFYDRLGENRGGMKAVIPYSAIGTIGQKELLSRLANLPEGARVAVVGATNVGKSTLVNRLTQAGLTTSRFPRTTMGFTEHTLSRPPIVLIDTPGLPARGRLYERLCDDCQKLVFIAHPLTPVIFRLKEGQAVMCGGLAALSVLSGENVPTVGAFFSDRVKLHQTRSERVEELRDKHRGVEWLIPPCDSCGKAFTVWERHRFNIPADGVYDVAIHGLGWFSIRRGPAEVEVQVPKEVAVTFRPALIGPMPGVGKFDVRNS